MGKTKDKKVKDRKSKAKTPKTLVKVEGIGLPELVQSGPNGIEPGSIVLDAIVYLQVLNPKTGKKVQRRLHSKGIDKITFKGLENHVFYNIPMDDSHDPENEE